MNVVLIGMSGAGKSTLGVLLAKALNMNYVDTDRIVEDKQGRLLKDIIDTDGIEVFKEVEERTITGLQLDNYVISTGGSVVYSDQSMNALKRNAKVVYLHVPYDEIQARLAQLPSRAIVKKEGYTLEDVYKERLPLYIKHSNFVVNCSNKDIQQCLDEIIIQLEAI